MKTTHFFPARCSRTAIQGFMLLEVLISVLLFSLGFIAIVGLQARTLSNTGEVQYRAEAVHLANAYVAKIWAYQGKGSELQTRFANGGTEYETFKEQVSNTIPGAREPEVEVNPADWQATVLHSTKTYPMDQVDVKVVISWVEHNPVDDSQPVVHNYTHITTVAFPATN